MMKVNMCLLLLLTMQMILRTSSSSTQQSPRRLLSEASLSKASANQLSAPFGFLGFPSTFPHVDRTIRSIIVLDQEADWQKAVEKNVARQNLYNNVVKEVFNGLTRMVGWTLISLSLYGFSNLSLFSRRKREAGQDFMETFDKFVSDAVFKYE
eukprot:GFUD01075288.1.p1 GENE.GFUD01075288.1~~GFUD01075288.1.p1  ORF type:complete len:153 (+),score=33.41 GFUD01075288.1:48-506(+)